MPNIKSAKKRVKVNATKTLRNKGAMSDLRTSLKKADFALTNSTEDAKEKVTVAVKKLDKAVSKGILHKNAAARKKSRLVVRLNGAK